MSQITTHVLDTSTGRPAAGVPVWLKDESGSPLAIAATDAEGRVTDLGTDELAVGSYSLVFDTATYFQAMDVTGFFPTVTVAFTVSDAAALYHVPLLLSPFGYSTYRGS